MDSEYQPIDTPVRRGRSLKGGLILALLAFLAGIVAMYLVLARWQGAPAWLKPRGAVPVALIAQPAVVPPALPVPSSTLPVADLSAIDRRIARLEGTVDEIETRADAATGNADRAEGLLVAFAARRALDRGTQLGYIESLLRERFGANQPQAVATILSAGRQPVTLGALDAELEEIAPKLATSGVDESWWTGIRREFAGLIVVHRANQPSTAPADRMERAGRQLESGDVEAALAEVARMPGRDAASGWIAKARRYVAARNALDAIETAALLSPRDPAPVPGVLSDEAGVALPVG